MESFDVVVVGAGPGGEVAAGRLAQAGLDVAIVETELVGGECSFYACMPSKALLWPGELLAQARQVPGLGAALSGSLDVDAVLRRRDELIGNLDDSGQLPWLAERGVTLRRGWGRVVGARRVDVGGRIVEARRAVILAAGTRAVLPSIPGLAEASPWTNREITTAARIPESLVVIGGGVVGAEMCQAYVSLGTQVTLLEGPLGLLPREEDFVGDQVRASLVEQGVDVRREQGASAVRRRQGGVTVTVDGGASVTAQELLVATGRAARSEDLGLDSIGLATSGYVEVDDHMRVPPTDWLYAIGDLNGRALFTHMAKYQAAIAAGDILGEDVTHEHLADGAGSPRVIFTAPQVAAVGHTSATAQAAGLRVRVVDVPTDGNAGGAFTVAPRGTSRFLIDEDRQVLIGATITGTGVAESLHAATIAVVAEVPLRRLRHAIPAFPTRSEIWLGLFTALGL